jgi:uncharacterized protein YprB with RNaseH-like and TPR domain
MRPSLLHWCDLYNKFKYSSLCLDIETTHFNGPISVIGLYQPKEGVMECLQFIKHQNLSRENLVQSFKNCKMLITFNGRYFDVPKVKKEFPGVISDSLPIVDLYLISRKLKLNTNLKTLENTFSINRPFLSSKRKVRPTRLWQNYEKTKNPRFLELLLEYNRQDTINLYPLAEELISLAYRMGER